MNGEHSYWNCNVGRKHFSISFAKAKKSRKNDLVLSDVEYVHGKFLFSVWKPRVDLVFWCSVGMDCDSLYECKP